MTCALYTQGCALRFHRPFGRLRGAMLRFIKALLCGNAVPAPLPEEHGSFGILCYRLYGRQKKQSASISYDIKAHRRHGSTLLSGKIFRRTVLSRSQPYNGGCCPRGIAPGLKRRDAPSPRSRPRRAFSLRHASLLRRIKRLLFPCSAYSFFVLYQFTSLLASILSAFSCCFRKKYLFCPGQTVAFFFIMR